MYVASQLHVCAALGRQRTVMKPILNDLYLLFPVMLSTFSLDVLINISKHPALAPFVKHVIIGLDQYEPPVRHHSWSDISQCEAFRNGWADQYTLTSSGRDREMLAEAFRNLPNLSTVGIRDYNAQGRTRDEDRWRSYGAPTASRQSGIPLRGASSEYATRVYTLLFQALADANNPTRSVEIILRTPGTGLSDFAFFLPAVTTMRPVLDGLQQLLLTLNFKEHLSMDNPVIAYQTSSTWTTSDTTRHRCYASRPENIVAPVEELY